MGNTGPLVGHLLSPNEPSSTRNGCHLVELLAKGPGNPQATQAVARTVSCPPQADGKAPLLKAPPTQFTEHGEVGLEPTQNLHPYMLVS